MVDQSTNNSDPQPTDLGVVQPPPRLLGWWEQNLLGGVLMLLAAVLTYVFLKLWPPSLDLGPNTGPQTEVLFGWIPVSTLPESRLILLVACAGALGGLIHALRSFSSFSGNRQLVASWTYWYLMRPVSGTLLALVFYLLIRGGFITGAIKEGAGISVAGFVGAAALVGLFSDLALDKLKEVFRTLFAGQEDERGDRLKAPDANPAPKVDSVQPSQLALNTNNLDVQLLGHDFVSNSTVTVDGKPRSSKLMPDGSLVLTLDPADVAVPGSRQIVVANPLPGGGTSKVSLTVA